MEEIDDVHYNSRRLVGLVIKAKDVVYPPFLQPVRLSSWALICELVVEEEKGTWTVSDPPNTGQLLHEQRLREGEARSKRKLEPRPGIGGGGGGGIFWLVLVALLFAFGLGMLSGRFVWYPTPDERMAYCCEYQALVTSECAAAPQKGEPAK
jgi:hypothetical protein